MLAGGELPLIPVEQLPKCRAAMAILRLLFGGEFGKRFLNLRKIKQRIVSKPIRSAWRIENYSFGRPAKGRQRLSVSRRGQYTNETPGAVFRRHLPQFS